MPRIDLYLIPGSAFSDICEFCIRLSEKAFRAGHRVHIDTMNRHESEMLDRLLWESDKCSFLPHALLNDEHNSEPATPITLSDSGLPIEDQRDVLIQYENRLHEALDSFKRIALIVPNDQDSLKSARSNYKRLTEQKLTVHTHDLRPQSH